MARCRPPRPAGAGEPGAREDQKKAGRKVTCYDDSGNPYSVDAEGSEAKHIIDLLAAEGQGRLVVLPCAIGDRIYRLAQRALDVYEVEVDRQFLSDGEITIFAHPVLQDGRQATCYEVCKGKDFGETVFLTRKEAETALEAQKGGDTE